MARTWIPISLFAALALTTTPARADQTMRCPTGRLVRLGDRLVEVAEVCGAPAWTDRRTVLRASSRRVRRFVWDERRGVWDDDVQVAVEVRIDEWLYDLGPGRLLRRLVFDDGRLVQIDTLGRGRDR